jgi:hypothetical protein
MESIDFSNYKFRCSALGNLMTNQQGKKDTKSIEELSATAIQELVKIYVKEVYGREKEISSKYIEKGLAVEEDSITLLSRVHMIPFFKNTDRKTNDFITGEADIIDPRLLDTKSCWDLHTFMAHKISKLSKAYEYQINGYCDLYGFNEGSVCFCLIDTPLGLIEEEKRRLFYKMNVPTMENPQYLEACAAIEKEMMFNDIPLQQRVHEVIVKRSPATIENVYNRVHIWREWLNTFCNRLIEVKTLETV